MKIKIIMVILLSSCFFYVFSQKDWTWIYKRHFTEFEQKHYQNELTFEKVGIPNFSQLILSWNAYRPEKGYYSFWVRARDAQTKNWFDWHKMIEWGRSVQKSYYSKSKDDSNGCHVRLEVKNGHLADGFDVKVKTHNGADSTGFQLLAVNTSNMKKFSVESKRTFSRLPSVLIDGVPQNSQMILKHKRAKQLCSPTSTSMLVNYLNDKKIDPIDFAGKAYDQGLNAFGSWPFNTAAAFEMCDKDVSFYVRRLPSFLHLYDNLKRDYPVVVSVRGKIPEGAKPYTNGHLMLVVGWNKDNGKVVCHDPAFESDVKTLKEYDLQNFLRVWENSRRLSYIMQA